jgi:seryl-tRNA synthetase
MIDKKIILENYDYCLKKLKTKSSDEKLFENFQSLYDTLLTKKKLLTELENLKASFNKETSDFFKNSKTMGDEEKEIKKLQLSSDKNSIRDKEITLNNFLQKEESLVLEIPNLPSSTSPVGSSDTDNPVIKTHLKDKCYAKSLTHDQVGGSFLSQEDGARLSGTRFVVLHGALAKLERSLINFFLDKHTSNGYREVMVPYVVTRDVMTGTGQLPKFEEDLFSLKTQLSNQDAFLIPTAEVPVTNLYRDTIVSEDDLPIKHCAFTPCFRAEAGSGGRDAKGLIRLHQFHKVELVILSNPSDSLEWLEKITADAESCLQDLGLPYQVVERCTADLGFGGYKGYDIEVWMAGHSSYREISSCTLFSDFQARRAKIRYKDENKKNNFVHTLNASGLAVGRTMAAILEYYQDGDNVVIPECLVPYFGKSKLF